MGLFQRDSLFLFATHGCRKGLFYTPPSYIEPSPKGGMRDASFGNPSSKYHCFATKCKYAVCSLIAVLFFSGAPSYIARFVVAIIVNSVELIAFVCGLANVSKKIRKGFTPFFTDHNTSPPPEVVISVRRPIASANHVLPCEVGFRAFCASMAVRSSGYFARFVTKTSATFCVATFKTIAQHVDTFATFTLADPHGASVASMFGIGAYSNNCKPAKYLACQVDMFHADQYITWVS